MDINEQVLNLSEQKDRFIRTIDDLKAAQALHRADNARLRRMYNSLSDSDITYRDYENKTDLKLSGTLHAIILDNDTKMDVIQKNIDVLNAEIRKYTKAIDTLKALTNKAA